LCPELSALLLLLTRYAEKGADAALILSEVLAGRQASLAAASGATNTSTAMTDSSVCEMRCGGRDITCGRPYQS
jgi:hypothetical protein